MHEDDANSRPNGENPEWSADDIANAKPGAATLKDLGVEVPPVRRGRPPAADPKEQVTLRIRRSTLDHFKKGGQGWQSRIDDELHKIAVGKRKR